MRGFLFGLLALCLGVVAAQAADCPKQDGPARASVLRLQEALAKGRFVAYQPTALKMVDGKATRADEASIAADLKSLKPYFDGLITYSARDGAEAVPDIAAKLGFRTVVMGVWNPRDAVEVNNALAAAKRNPIVLGLSLGNEMVLGKRANWDDLAGFLDAVRARAPNIALTTTEPFAQFLEPSAKTVLARIDFMAVNIHPIFESWFATATPFNWADFVVKASDKMAEAYCGPILVKETGVPTGPTARGFNETKQRAFYAALRMQMRPTRMRAFAYFTGFDAAWREWDLSPGTPGPHPEEAHWGLFTETRQPKPAVGDLR